MSGAAVKHAFIAGDLSYVWGNGGPAGVGVVDQFSGRFTGRINMDQVGTYTFNIAHDDGVRLWIDDTLVVDDWALFGTSTPGQVVVTTPGWKRIRIELVPVDNGPSSVYVGLKYYRSIPCRCIYSAIKSKWGEFSLCCADVYLYGRARFADVFL